MATTIFNPRITIDPTTDALRVDGKPLRWTLARTGYRTLLLTSTIEGDRFVFLGGRFGAHSLDIGSTSPERLVAHWRGYVQSTEETLTGAGAKAFVKIDVHEETDDETGEERFAIHDDGGEFDCVEVNAAPDIQTEIDTRVAHYRAAGSTVTTRGDAMGRWS